MMTLATMADNALPLAERVNAAYLVGIQVADGDENGQDARAALDALRADVAAADRLARACIPPLRHDDPSDDQKAYDANFYEYEDALDAYRARVQGVARG